MNPRQIVFLLAAIVFFVGSLLPKPVIEKAFSKRFDELWWVRVCLASSGVIMILTWHTVR
jgi:hypothetical protein